MITYNFKIALRQLKTDKVFSIINLISLVVGTTIFLFVANFINFELSFEDFNPTAERTYRVNLYDTHNGVFDNISAETVSGLAYDLRAVAGISQVARLSYKTKGIVENKKKDMKALESRIVYADSNIFPVLGINIFQGNLKSSKSVAVSTAIAEKYFGSTNVVGETIDIGYNNNTLLPTAYEIGAVFEQIPFNSHVQFDIMLPVEKPEEWDQNWEWSNVSTYVVLKDKAAIADLAPALASIVTKRHSEDTGDKYLLEPIRDIRLKALDGSGRQSVVSYFFILGVVILVLAWINYINLSTSRFLERLKEVGLKKLIGATRRNLIIQFLIEAFLFNAVSFLASVLLFMVTRPFVVDALQLQFDNTLAQKPVLFSFAAIGIVLLGTILSGLYPAIFLSSFKPLQTLQGKIGFGDRSLLRKILVTFQLSIALFLVISILTVRKQVEFLTRQNIGLSINNTLIIEEPLMTDNNSIQSFEPFKKEISQYSFVKGVTYASSFPGGEIEWHRTDIKLNDENAELKYDSRIISIGTEFLSVFDIPLLAGRNFNPDIPSDNKAMLLNEKAVQKFGFKENADAIGKIVFIGSRRFEVIGVVKNYHFQSLKFDLQPILFIEGYPRNPSYAIKTSSADFQQVVSAIEQKWKLAYPGNVFRYYLLDQHFQEQYKTETQTINILQTLTLFAFLIACSGLFGLSVYTATKRSKEIGIRKVLGASVISVVFLLIRDYLKLIVISACIAVPIGYYIMTTWLDSYAYKMPIGIDIFLIPLGIICLITLSAIGYQSLLSARKNPVDSIKYE